MAGLIPQSFINELLARVDIVDVIDSRIGLKKAGRNFTACCPFHNEKTPSFSVSPDKQFYYCFGCGVSGNALSFLMEYEGQDFVSAVENLAGSLGMEVPRETSSPAQKQQQSQFQRQHQLLAKVSEYFEKQLAHPAIGKRAVNYLKNRGLSGQIAKQYGIGYAPSQWQNLLPNLPAEENLKQDLIDTGMLIEKDDGQCYDRFRDRVMFPIRNRKGQVIGFGGRVLDKGEPKYLNSPETALFHKGRELYGLFEMRRQLRSIEHVLIVEGYMDVVALAQFGIANAAATLGTATTSEHLQTLFRICPKVVFCFDGDKAGRAAAMRALEHALPELKDIRDVRFMFLPEGEDPDSLVRKVGAEGFRAAVADASSLLDYLLSWLSQQVDMQSTEGPARLIHLAKPWAKMIQDPLLLSSFSRQLALQAGIEQAQIEASFGQPDGHQHGGRLKSQTHSDVTESEGQPVESRQRKAKATQQPGPYRRAISLVLRYPQSVPAADVNWLGEMGDAGADILRALIAEAQNDEAASTESLLASWQEKPEFAHLQKLTKSPLVVSADGVAGELVDTIRNLEKTFLEKQLNELLQQSREVPPDTAQKHQIRTLLQRIKHH